jgi:excisionase family DNA binding protein
MKPWLNVGEGAEYAGLSRDTIDTACERKELRHVHVGGRRSIRLKPEWIDDWLERHASGVQESFKIPPNRASLNAKTPPRNPLQVTESLKLGELVPVRGFEPRSRG